MANVTETSTWESGIYQLETTDPVEGGALGISNLQPKQLGNRTKWLYDKLPKNTGYFTGLDVGWSSGYLSVGGDITSAFATASNSDSFVTVTMLNAMVGTNYLVRCNIESKGTLDLDDDISREVVKIISNTQFQIGIKELNPSVQNLRFHFEVIQL